MNEVVYYNNKILYYNTND